MRATSLARGCVLGFSERKWSGQLPVSALRGWPKFRQAGSFASCPSEMTTIQPRGFRERRLTGGIRRARHASHKDFWVPAQRQIDRLGISLTPSTLFGMLALLERLGWQPRAEPADGGRVVSE
jgi:hypothetical protein